MTPNNDGINDFLSIEFNTPEAPDSSHLRVRDTCGTIFYDSKYSASGIVDPPHQFAKWDETITPDSASYHQPIRNAPSGHYWFHFIINEGNSGRSILGKVQLTRP